ncbi:MAG TPA: Rid family detoxifying hydrolase [Gemmatimonadaceae bacterium]|jgi:2-iminobutanoate/2-iminopropanoate deaminase
MRKLLLAVLITSLAACSRPPELLQVEFIPSPRPTAVFSQAVRVGNMLYLSGDIGADASGKLVPGGIQAEGRQALNNIKATLEKNGSALDRVVKCTVFLADMKDYDAFNEIYASYFRSRKPARSAMAASGLALGARVEIECMAVVST